VPPGGGVVGFEDGVGGGHGSKLTHGRHALRR
jgi:hypothetical protein